MRKKPGRPPIGKDGPRKRVLQIKMTDGEFKKLRTLADAQKTSIAEVLMRVIRGKD